MESVRPQSWEHLFEDDVNVLVTGDIWAKRHWERLFTMPSSILALLPNPQPNIFWWWTELMGFLMRPGPALSAFIETQKQRMGWQTPVIGIHMRLGMDKNMEAQRFPTSYYIHEARRIKNQFGIRRVFVCSDRRRAVDKMLRKYSGEFDFVVQPPAEDVSPMFTLLTDLLLLAETTVPILTFSSNFGQAALLLNSFYNHHRPTYISMDDVYQGFRDFGWELRLRRDSDTGVNSILMTDCVNDDCLTQDQAMASGDHRVLGFDFVSPDGNIITDTDHF
mmetsp:Transcript_28827/g.68068  ORF Transcript_28827/g.68068 Transcript_28827/m.68068 type:complete len:277 (+) Transcript_28827:521-1351(+)